ncbi:MAG: recombinase [Aequorivita sp.]|nr:recombinase [Aequorivita sp.]|tara:strand:+ start:32126 stop:32530 length:405 start_codon:yes stop_codon:yes gene_type:complete
MARPKSLKTLKKESARLFQLYIRLRDSDLSGFGNCCSCGKNVHYKEADGGHFISRGYLCTLFNEKNVHLQCKRCNMMGGNASGYALFMLDKYGQEIIEELNIEKNMPTKYSKAFYEMFIEEFKKKVKDLEEEKA